jgi:hypothetical protein
LRAIETWAHTRRNFLINLGGQRDPRFGLPISKVVFRSTRPAFAIRQFPDMLWGTFSLVLDFDYCVTRLSRAFPLIHVLDSYGALSLDSSFYVLEEDTPTCDPDMYGDPGSSAIERRPPSLASRIFPRNTMARLKAERLRDGMLRHVARQFYWPLERTQGFLDDLEGGGFQ